MARSDAVLAMNINEDMTMNTDLEAMTREQLIAEVTRLQEAVREHRNASGYDLCWHQPGLWSLLPEETDVVPEVPEWPMFIRGCVRYRQSLDSQLPQAKRVDGEFNG